jgi:hypothetical protein
MRTTIRGCVCKRERRGGASRWLAGMCALLVSGCAGTNPQSPSTPPPTVVSAPAPVAAPAVPPAGPPDRAEGTDEGSSFDNLDVIDSSLNAKLAVLRVGSDPSANNLLSVFAGLKNKTAHRLALEVETIYKDKEGNALNAGSWIAFTLKPHEEQEYRSTAISEDAVDFLIRVRRAPE